MRTSKRKANEQYQSAPLIHTANAPTPAQIRQRTHDIYIARAVRAEWL